MKVLDANVVIAFLDEGNALHADARRVLDLGEDEQLLMHALTIAEVLSGPARAGESAARHIWSRMLELQIEEVGIDGTPLDIARMRASTGLPVPDCLVLLAAGAPGDGAPGRATTILTFDRRLAAKGRELGYAIEP